MPGPPFLFEIVGELRSTLLGQPFLTATPNTSNPAREEVCERPDMTHRLAFYFFLPAGFKQMDSDPINWGKAAGVSSLQEGSV